MRDVDRRLGHQVGDELRAVDGVELVGLREGHAEEAAGERVPEGRVAGLVHHSAKLGQHAVAEARAVLLDEQIAAAREQHARARRRARCGWRNRPPTSRRPFEVGASGSASGCGRSCPSSGLVWVSVLRSVGVEGLVDADLAEHLAGAADLRRSSGSSSTNTYRSSDWLSLARARSLPSRPRELVDQRRPVGAAGW